MVHVFINPLVPNTSLDAQALWAAAIIVIALLLTLFMLIRRRDIAYGLVVWASIGISFKQSSFPIIYWAAFISVGVIITIIIIIVTSLIKKKVQL